MLLLIETWFGGLLLVFRLHQLIDGQVILREALFDPGERQGQRGALALQAARELGDERADHGRLGARHVGDQQDESVGIGLDDRGHLVGPIIGEVAVGARGGNAGADAAEIFDQRQARHDGDGPQFAQLQSGDGLIGGEETAQAIGVDASVGVGDGFENDVVDAGEPGGGSVRQAREFAAVAFRKVTAGGADLFFDEIEIIQQPFAGGSGAAAIFEGLGEQRVRGDQDVFVFGEAREKLLGVALGTDGVGVGQRLGVLVHLLGIEKLGSEGSFVDLNHGSVTLFGHLTRYGQDDAQSEVNPAVATPGVGHVGGQF